MTRSLVAAGVAILLIAAGPGDDLDRLQGSWKLVREHSGSKDYKNVTSVWIITGNSLTMRLASSDRGTIKLDPTKKPGRFEMAGADYPDAKVVGTYSLERDTLKLYTRMTSRVEPPTDLPDEPARGYELVTWKRVRPEGNPEGIDGEWRQVSFLVAARPNLTSRFGEVRIKFRGNSYERRYASERRCEISLDPSKDPKHIDLKFEADVLRGKHTEPQVYRLDGDCLTVWQGLHARPAVASDAPESPQHYQVFERAKR
jgi:uncharacterized protein (TIGR03067 family)